MPNDREPAGDAPQPGDTLPQPGDTLPLPDALDATAPREPDPAADPPFTADTVPLERIEHLDPEPRGERRPRWWLRISIVVVVLALLAVAAEFAIRAIAPGIITNAVRDSLSLSEEHPVEVELGGIQLVSAVTGHLGDVSIEVPDAKLVPGLTGSVRLHADEVPFAYRTGEIAGGTASLTVDEAQLQSAVGLLTGGFAESGEVRGGDLVVSRDVSFFGVNMPMRATLGLSVDGGDVTIEPKGLGAAGLDLSAEDLGKALGGLADGILRPHTVCVRDRLPAGLELTDIDLLSTGAARLSVAVSPDILSDPAQLETGVC